MCPEIATLDDCFIFNLFQRTKAAHAFHFYKGPLNPDLLDIRVRAKGIVHCFKDGGLADCENVFSVVDFSEKAGAKIAIGKATLVVEEHNNWQEF